METVVPREALTCSKLVASWGSLMGGFHGTLALRISFQSNFRNHECCLISSPLLREPRRRWGLGLSRASIRCRARSEKKSGNQMRPFSIFLYIFLGSSLSQKGGQPASSQQISIPMPQQSTALPYPVLLTLSSIQGARYSGVPHMVKVRRWCNFLAKPRSISFGQPSASTMMFQGLRSRNTISRVCRWQMASSTPATQNMAV